MTPSPIQESRHTLDQDLTAIQRREWKVEGNTEIGRGSLGLSFLNLYPFHLRSFAWKQGMLYEQTLPHEERLVRSIVIPEDLLTAIYCFWVRPARPATRNEPRTQPSSFWK